MNTTAMLNEDHEFASLVQALVDHTSSVIYVKDVDFRYLLINRQFETLFHVKRADAVGKTDFDLFATELASGFRTNDKRVLETGEALQFEEIAPQDDGLHCYLSLKFPLRDAQGKIYAMAGISTDITDRIHAQQRIASLQYHQDLILGSVDNGICSLDAAGRVVFLNRAAEQILQWTSNDLRGKCHSHFVMHPTDPAREIGELNPVLAVLNGKAAVHYKGATFRRRDGSIVPVEFTVAPIQMKDTTAGVVVAFRDTTERLKHVRIEQEVQTAHQIQLSLNPKQVPEIDGFEFAASSISCSKACGDYYDFIRCGKNCLGIAVGDVSGHGLAAALEMVETRAILRATMLRETDPVQCLSGLNELLTDDLPDEMFVTLFLSTLNISERTLTYASAGHDALFLSAAGEFRRLESTGAVLGFNHASKYERGQTIRLKSGDLLLIATDGISESVSPDRALFGRDRIVELMRRHQARSASEILNAIQSAAQAFRGNYPQRDDMTAVIMKVV